MSKVMVRFLNDNQRAPGKKLVAAWIDSELHNKIEKQAKSLGLTVSDIIIRALRK